MTKELLDFLEELVAYDGYCELLMRKHSITCQPGFGFKHRCPLRDIYYNGVCTQAEAKQFAKEILNEFYVEQLLLKVGEKDEKD